VLRESAAAQQNLEGHCRGRLHAENEIESQRRQAFSQDGHWENPSQKGLQKPHLDAQVFQENTPTSERRYAREGGRKAGQGHPAVSLESPVLKFPRNRAPVLVAPGCVAPPWHMSSVVFGFPLVWIPTLKETIGFP